MKQDHIIFLMSEISKTNFITFNSLEIAVNGMISGSGGILVEFGSVSSRLKVEQMQFDSFGGSMFLKSNSLQLKFSFKAI